MQNTRVIFFQALGYFISLLITPVLRDFDFDIHHDVYDDQLLSSTDDANWSGCNPITTLKPCLTSFRSAEGCNFVLLLEETKFCSYKNHFMMIIALYTGLQIHHLPVDKCKEVKSEMNVLLFICSESHIIRNAQQ